MTAKKPLAAIMDIGSNYLRMRAAQATEEGTNQLDALSYPTELGHDSFVKGSVEAETVDEISRCIGEFCVAAEQLGIRRDEVRLIAATALREAENCDYVADRISLRTGLEVEILEDAQEKSFIFCEVMRRLHAVGRLRQGTALLVYIGSGTISFAVLRDGVIVYLRSLDEGSLTIAQMMAETPARPSRAYEALEEYVRAMFAPIEHQVAQYAPQHLVLCGRDLELGSHIIEYPTIDGLGQVTEKQFAELYGKVKRLVPAEISQVYPVSAEQSVTILPLLSIFLRLARIASTGAIMFSGVTSSDWLLYEMLQPKRAKRWRNIYERGILVTTKENAARLGSDMIHVETVERAAVTLFNMLRKVHGFSRRERTLLQVAATMHDCGRYVNMQNHQMISSSLTQLLAYTGLSQREVTMAALIVRYHTGEEITREDPDYSGLSREDALTVSKLLAILRLADSLDTGRNQKLSDISVEREENTVVVLARATRSCALEQWAFARSAAFFSEVFGLECRLKIVRGE